MAKERAKKSKSGKSKAAKLKGFRQSSRRRKFLKTIIESSSDDEANQDITLSNPKTVKSCKINAKLLAENQKRNPAQKEIRAEKRTLMIECKMIFIRNIKSANNLTNEPTWKQITNIFGNFDYKDVSKNSIEDVFKRLKKNRIPPKAMYKKMKAANKDFPNNKSDWLLNKSKQLISPLHSIDVVHDQKNLLDFEGISKRSGPVKRSGLSHALLFSIGLSVIQRFGKDYSEFDVREIVGYFIRTMSENPLLREYARFSLDSLDENTAVEEVMRFISGRVSLEDTSENSKDIEDQIGTEMENLV